jgi:hypothetical protein
VVEAAPGSEAKKAAQAQAGLCNLFFRQACFLFSGIWDCQFLIRGISDPDFCLPGDSDSDGKAIYFAINFVFRNSGKMA